MGKTGEYGRALSFSQKGDVRFLLCPRPHGNVFLLGLRFQPVEQVTWVPIFPWESGEDRTVSLEKTQ